MSTSSMTGFGKSQFTHQNKSFSIEIKCLNSKQQDIVVRMPSLYKAKEMAVRNALIGGLRRGKIELYLNLDMGNSAVAQSINKEVFNAYAEQLKALTDPRLSDELVAAILRMPDVLGSQKEELGEEEWAEIAAGVDEAIAQVQEFRLDEGKNLAEDLLQRASSIREKLQDVIALDEVRTKNIRTRLEQAVSEIQEAHLDKNRFEQELIYYLEKLDITEEKVRLKSHLDYFEEMLQQAGEKGKKLGFIAQEIGREINTIGSKANDSAIQQVVVQMKDELEKIKEQALNIL